MSDRPDVKWDPRAQRAAPDAQQLLTALSTEHFTLQVAAGVGGAVAIVSVLGWIRYADRLLDAGAAQTEPLFPSP